jgi:hypothetical protein
VAETTTNQPLNWAWIYPAGLIDAEATKQLTFNWLKAASKEEIIWVEDPRPGQLTLVLFMTLAVPALMAGALCLYMDYRSAILIALIFAVVFAILARIYVGLPRGRRRTKKVGADPALMAWKEARTKREFWDAFLANNDLNGFIRECAELVAWQVQSRNVHIALANPYGASIFAMQGVAPVVARCLLTFGVAPVDVARDFAGTKGYFSAARGIFFSHKRVADGSAPVNNFSTRVNLQYFDVEALVLMAKAAKDRPGPAPTTGGTTPSAPH